MTTTMMIESMMPNQKSDSSMNAYLLEEQSCHVSSWSDLQSGALP